MARLKDIAKLANVSIATVSRVLSNDDKFKVKNETRDLIFKIAKENNYKVKNKKDSNIIKNSNKKVALITGVSNKNQFSNPYFIELWNEVQSSCTKRGYFVEYCHLNFVDISKIKNSFDYFLVMGHINNKQIKDILDYTNKVIFIGSSPPPVEYDSIRPNFQDGMNKIFEHIFTLNLDSLGFIGADVKISSNNESYGKIIPNERLILFKSKAQEADLFDKRYVMNGEYVMASGYEMMENQIKTSNLAKAYIVANDFLAMGVVKALVDYNIKVPDDVKIISFDNSNLATYSSISLTSLDLNIKSMAESIFLLIESRNNGRDFPIEISVPTKLIIRKSSQK
ncbi:LacI family DNA-binding transcriptional regulator [Anaerococcus sp. AGMB00486]|uniref:LacI family DNA-binding transcriptional regulator n=2 Tax=Anaerococcus TaxID=165779 RepID=A0ABX2NA88_9FIRM|nr:MULTISPECIES: LacI family DNA-binding transcriptional regulator [Anaerococcus]MSS77728.1 LacI family transcriptional regulator [Anaerococcus porci]NVF11583.1 LacI family DNA-binding transcriptional regulator [Anaerococcus faecalis]